MIEPEPGRWREVASPFPSLTSGHRRFRAQLGLATDRPIVLTGHQAQVWHPGILAKYLAADAAARMIGAVPAWLVVDQDDNDPGAVRYPVRTSDGRFRARSWGALGGAAGGTATGRIPAAPPSAVPTLPEGSSFAAGSVLPGLQRIHRALVGSAEMPSAAAQLAEAVSLLMRPLIQPAATVFATSLSRTDEFGALLGRMQGDPRSCVDSYNGAVSRHREARIRPLAVTGSGSRFELPLWRFESARRIPVFSDELRDLAPDRLAPRALLMTGLLRTGACDLFVHGTGGGGADAGAGYEAITDDWFRVWLGAPPPAPVAVVTATLRLPIAAETDPGTPDEVGRAVGLAHRARHDPRLLGDEDAAARKRALVARIAALKAAGEDARPVYRQMHAMLDTIRSAHQRDLARLDAQAAAGSARRIDAMILADRTWPFPLYPDAMLRDLKSRIDAAFGV